MSATEHAFTTVGGVAVHYARMPVAAYGTRGVARTFHCTRAFYTKLDNCFNELWRVSPHGRPTVITSAGSHVNKPGLHGQGRAFDLDAIFWGSKTLITNNFTSDPKYYLGVEAILRKHFGVVLDYNYNAAHQDHFHIDDSGVVGFSTARSHTVFMQAVCVYIFGKTFTGMVDGGYGSATRTVLNEVCAEMGVATPLTDRANWLSFLDGVAQRGMSNTPSTRLPADHSCTRR